jgi:hypothetical protein
MTGMTGPIWGRIPVALDMPDGGRAKEGDGLKFEGRLVEARRLRVGVKADVVSLAISVPL